MVAEFIPSDVHGLARLAFLVDAYNVLVAGGLVGAVKAKDLHAEILKDEQRFGLSPLDRRRLQWEIEPQDEKLPEVPPEVPEEDPRKLLRAVK